MEVTKYGPGGVAQQIVVTGELGSVTVDTENKIRTALGGNGYTIEKQDGTVIDSMALLPSAFFTVEYQDGNYVLDGGGFGHGIGMSQNGANEMAKKGKNYLEILTTFYHDVEVTVKFTKSKPAGIQDTISQCHIKMQTVCRLYKKQIAF